jgi:hypothetical protein
MRWWVNSTYIHLRCTNIQRHVGQGQGGCIKNSLKNLFKEFYIKQHSASQATLHKVSHYIIIFYKLRYIIADYVLEQASKMGLGY